MKRKGDIETAAALVERLDEEERAKKADKKPIVRELGEFIQTAKTGINTAGELYADWVKPLVDNRMQIARRLNAISMVLSVVFFLLYVPFLLFSKVADGLALGWNIALYVCIGVYGVTVVALLIVTLSSGRRVTTTTAQKRRKKTIKIAFFVVRMTSVALSVTALVIASTTNADGIRTVAHTVAMVFAVTSIVFSALPLFFGGIGGVIKWLISPPKNPKYTLAFVALEWYGTVSPTRALDKTTKRMAKRYGDTIAKILDTYILPEYGKQYIKTVDIETLSGIFDAVPEGERLLAEWVIGAIFEYAEGCGYIEENLCSALALADEKEVASGKRKSDATDTPLLKRFASFFGGKHKEGDNADCEVD